ncbi:oocyte zinc finger protein XlCOF20-like [Belonocnema kinseyi]|uniref:oocyte zinc finger protein XlCOF20-like n=1 Tax=Belonocnema kinseyi TaxID=2817044 RepID=UPI00143D73B8|nr:oocyte zinc finger protein XlCOF20-like [Belonocnema kinseyi]
MYKEVSPKTKRFPCPNNCGRSFNFKHTLEDHIRTVCGKMRFACPYCSKQCRKNWSASLHIKYRHPGRKNYVIDLFKRKEAKESLKKKDNTDIEVVEIDDNDDPSGSRNSNLPVEENNCPFCGEFFQDSLNLGMHIKYDHLYNPVDEEEEIDDSREQQEQTEDSRHFNEDLRENLMVRIWRFLSTIMMQVLENITVQIAKAALEKGNLCCLTLGTNVENLLDSNVPTAFCVQKKLRTSISILEKFTP